jgi:hypothetical protein
VRSVRTERLDHVFIFNERHLQKVLAEYARSWHAGSTPPVMRSPLARGDLNDDANLGDTNITHPAIESGAITAVAVMNEERCLRAPARGLGDWGCGFGNALVRVISHMRNAHALSEGRSFVAAFFKDHLPRIGGKTAEDHSTTNFGGDRS